MTTPNKLEIELKKVAPVFTDKTLELLWKWFEAKQEEKLQEQLNCLFNFKNIIKWYYSFNNLYKTSTIIVDAFPCAIAAARSSLITGLFLLSLSQLSIASRNWL